MRSMGVGLAAPQVGSFKRIVVIDVGEGPIMMINPVSFRDFRRADRRRGMLKHSGQSRTGDKTELCESACVMTKIWKNMRLREPSC